MSCEHITVYVLSHLCRNFRSESQLQSPCSCTAIAENYLRPGSKPSALNLCKPPSPNGTGLTLPCCFTVRPDLQEAQLTSSKSSHGNLVSFHCVHLSDFKIYHDISRLRSSKEGSLRREHLLNSINPYTKMLSQSGGRGK